MRHSEMACSTSELGDQRTWRLRFVMSALTQQTDINRRLSIRCDKLFLLFGVLHALRRRTMMRREKFAIRLLHCKCRLMARSRRARGGFSPSRNSRTESNRVQETVMSHVVGEPAGASVAICGRRNGRLGPPFVWLATRVHVHRFRPWRARPQSQRRVRPAVHVQRHGLPSPLFRSRGWS